MGHIEWRLRGVERLQERMDQARYAMNSIRCVKHALDALMLVDIKELDDEHKKHLARTIEHLLSVKDYLARAERDE